MNNDQVFDFVDQVDTLPGVPDILAALLQQFETFGFEHFIFTGLPSGNETIGELVKTNQYPDEWWDRYLDQGYEHGDSVCQHAMRTANPFFWHDVPVLGDKKLAERIAGEAEEFGMADGYVVPLYSADHWQSVFSISAPFRLDLSLKEQGAINLLAIYAAAAIEKKLRQPGSAARLSTREMQVLELFVLGKTAWEVSRILGTSERTARFHAQNIMAKLDAVNMVHAVAKAIASDLIPKSHLSDLTGDVRGETLLS